MEEFKFERNLFGGKIIVFLYSENKNKRELNIIMKEFYEEALRLQKIFNFYDPESELSLLNTKRKLKVSDELIYLIEKTLNLSFLTHGKYDITLGNSILARKNGQKSVELNSNYKNIILKGNIIELNNDKIRLDLGSIAKGYITDKLGDFLKKKCLTNFLIDSRGDILVSGEQNHILGVQHPRDKDKNFLSLNLNNIAVATSADYNQFIDSYDYSHILNQNDLISITVLASSLEEADMYATALFVADKLDRIKIITNNKNIRVLTIDKNLNPEFYNGFEEFIYEK